MIAIDEIKNKHSAEMAIVVQACRVYFKTATVEELQELINSTVFDWKEVLVICRNHSVRPIVYKILCTTNNIPSGIALIIKEEYLTITTKSWHQALETERLILLLKENGIEAVPYKGTAFSKQFYGDLVSRESSDIDLVIQKENLSRVIAVMEKDGYIAEIKMVYDYLGNKYFKYYKDFNFNKFKKRERIFHIEFHWGVAEVYLGVNKNIDGLLYQTNGNIQLLKKDVAVLNLNAHYLAILVHHAVKDVFKSLKNISDIATVAQHNLAENDLRYINEQLDRLQIRKAFFLGNTLTTDILGISLVDKAQCKISRKQADVFLFQVLSKNIIDSHGLKSTKLFNARFVINTHSATKVRFIYYMIKDRFTPTIVDFRIICLPKPLFFIYCICKPFRSFIKSYNSKEEKARLIPGE
jgi:hypothetical protein